LYTENRSFYQDRLGTIIGKALKKRWGFRTGRDALEEIGRVPAIVCEPRMRAVDLRLPAENDGFQQLSLCLSQACLGEPIVFRIKTAQKNDRSVFSHHFGSVQRRERCSIHSIRKWVFFECVSLCLSRACLGKIIIFPTKWRKGRVFFQTSNRLIANNTLKKGAVIRNP
jgi:hypothetical protein